MSLKEKIEQATNLKQMNALRMEIVKAKDAVILKLWQDKFWGMKKCSQCGHIHVS